MQALYSDELRDLHGGYGVKYETAPVHPTLSAASLPGERRAAPRPDAASFAHVGRIGVLLRDRDGGEVRVGRDGEPVVRYRLSPIDDAHVRAGVDGAAQILEAAGARRIFSAHRRSAGYEPGAGGTREQFMHDADACGWGAGPVRLLLVPHHGHGADGRLGGRLGLRSGGRDWDVRDSSSPTARCSRPPRA